MTKGGRDGDEVRSVKKASIVTVGLSIVVWSWASLGVAGTDTSSVADGVYPLKPGIYVAQGSNCAAPAQAVVRQYDGKGIRSTSTRDCRAAVREQQVNTYTVDQTCLDTSVGLGRRFVQRQVVTVRDALSFTQALGKDSVTYRYCPAEQLPAGLRKAFE
jgi:hypothetical protein